MPYCLMASIKYHDIGDMGDVSELLDHGSFTKTRG